MSHPARILWLAKGLGHGGTEHLLASSAQHVDRKRFEVEVAYVLPWKDALVDEFTSRGMIVHCLGHGRRQGIGWVRRLHQLLRDGRYDLIHTHMPLPAVAARLLVRGRSPLLVHTEHNVWERYRWPTAVLNKLTYGRNEVALAVSESVARSIKPTLALGGRKPRVEVIVNGIDLGAAHQKEVRTAARRSLGLTDDDLVVGTVGSLTAKKDQHSLLAAIAMLGRSHPALRVVLIGSGPLDADLRAAAAAMGLGGRALFAGSRGDVLRLLPAFDIFALSSIYEGLPIALLEAMASRIPCVATSVGGTPEMLTDGVDGLLVPPSDVTSLAGALDRLLRDGALREELGAKGAQRAAQFEISRAVEQLQDVYDEVLGLR